MAAFFFTPPSKYIEAKRSISSMRKIILVPSTQEANNLLASSPIKVPVSESKIRPLPIDSKSSYKSRSSLFEDTLRSLRQIHRLNEGASLKASSSVK